MCTVQASLAGHLECAVVYFQCTDAPSSWKKFFNAIAVRAGSRELLQDTNMATVGAPSAGGDLGSAPAPGPGASMPQADVLFTLTSMNADLTADKLTMTDVANTALFSSASRQSGVYTMGARPLLNVYMYVTVWSCWCVGGYQDRCGNANSKCLLVREWKLWQVVVSSASVSFRVISFCTYFGLALALLLHTG